MSEERCELTDLLVSSCSHCRPNREMERIVGEMNAPLRPFGAWKGDDLNRGVRGNGLMFRTISEPASMPDTCASCTGRIEAGDPVFSARDGLTGVVHAHCA